MTMELSYNEELSITMANELLRAERDELSLWETKIIYLAISQISRLDTDFYEYSCSIADLADFLGISAYDMYGEMETVARNIIKKGIYLIDKKKPTKRNGNPNYNYFTWCDSARYNNGIMTFSINRQLKPYLLGLQNYFTKYGYNCIRYLPTSNSLRLFELIASYRNTIYPKDETFVNTNPLFPNIPIERNELLFSIKFLRKHFNCVDRYPQTGDFVKWVIAPSVDGINKKCSTMWLSYRPIKEGRKFTYIAFKILIDFEDKERIAPL